MTLKSKMPSPTEVSRKPCVRCRMKKKRCDKQTPCGRCVKACHLSSVSAQELCQPQREEFTRHYQPETNSFSGHSKRARHHRQQLPVPLRHSEHKKKRDSAAQSPALEVAGLDFSALTEEQITARERMLLLAQSKCSRYLRVDVAELHRRWCVLGGLTETYGDIVGTLREPSEKAMLNYLFQCLRGAYML